jgi:hypothetical protein
LFTSTAQRFGPNVDMLTSKKQFERIEFYYKQKQEEEEKKNREIKG